MVHWGLQPIPNQLLADVPVLLRDRQLLNLRGHTYKEAFAQLVVETIMMRRSWLGDYDGDDGVNCAQPHSYAVMNMHMDDVENHRSDLVLVVG